MAITKLGYIGDCKKGNKATHLYNAIHYIVNPKKTENGLWVGGNCGLKCSEAYDEMMRTKELFQKYNGRQGYHFVISFSPGEATEKKAFDVANEFCKKLFGDEYEYIFAVHNDQPHTHIHIVFNSVDRIDGLKYRYLKGDWEKKIQPITDNICKKYGLSELVYDKEQPRKGMSYAAHEAEENDRFTWTKIIKADIDFAIFQSESIEDYFKFMEGMGYKISRHGHSEKWGEYISYFPPGLEDRESKKAFRDYNKALRDGYRIEDIRRRIILKSDMDYPEIYSNEEFTYTLGKAANRFQVMAVNRIRMTDSYHFLDLKESDQKRVRRDLIDLDKLREEVDYILSNNVSGKKDLEERFADVKGKLSDLNHIDRSATFSDNKLTEQEMIDRSRYFYLQEKMSVEERNMSDEEFERVDEEIYLLEKKYSGNEVVLNFRNIPREEYKKSLLKEKRIISRILHGFDEFETCDEDRSFRSDIKYRENIKKESLPEETLKSNSEIPPTSFEEIIKDMSEDPVSDHAKADGEVKTVESGEDSKNKISKGEM